MFILLVLSLLLQLRLDHYAYTLELVCVLRDVLHEEPRMFCYTPEVWKYGFIQLTCRCTEPSERLLMTS